MIRGCWLAVAVALCLGCGVSRPAPTATPKPRCPTAEDLWPVLEWSPEIASEAVGLIAKTILEGEWLRERRVGGARPRVLVAPISNLTTFHFSRIELQGPLEARLLGSGALTLLSESSGSSKPDGLVHVQLRDLLELRGGERSSGFTIAIAIAAPGVEPRLPDSPAWRRTLQIARRLKPALRPSACPEPTWLCFGSGGHLGETECDTTWSCRNGRFTLACEATAGGKARCRCEAEGRPKKVFELPDFGRYEAESQRAANRECGWHLPAGR